MYPIWVFYSHPRILPGLPLLFLLSIIVAKVLAIYIDGNTTIKGIQAGDCEIKIVNCADDTTIFLRNFSCLTNIELILELSQKASSSKINSSKSQTLWCVAYKTRIDKSRQMVGSQFSIKMLEAHFHNYAHDKCNWNKINDNLTKKIHIWNGTQLSLRVRNCHKLKSSIKTVVQKSGIYYSKMYLEKITIYQSLRSKLW